MSAKKIKWNRRSSASYNEVVVIFRAYKFPTHASQEKCILSQSGERDAIQTPESEIKFKTASQTDIYLSNVHVQSNSWFYYLLGVIQ